LQFSGLTTHKVDFLVRKCADGFDCVNFVKTYCWNVDMCKSESSERYKSRAWQADSLNTHSKPRAVYSKQ